MANTIYEVYQGEELISSGRMAKVIEETGLSGTTIFNYCASGKDYKGWTFTKKTKPYAYAEVDYDKLKEKLKEFGLKYKDLAEVLEVTPMTISKKIQKNSRFKNVEIELLEDLFFLDEGELIKGE